MWKRFLFERYACFRPLNRVAAWFFDQGLPISAGTLGDSAHRFTPLFEPVEAAIRSRQNEAALRHGDETTWRVQSLREQGRSNRAWLWASLSADAVYFHVDPSRSAEGRDEALRRGRPPYSPRLRPLQRLQEAGAHSRGSGHSRVVLEPSTPRLYPLIRGRGAADAVGREMARACREALPPERCAHGALRPGRRTAGRGVQQGSGCAGEGSSIACSREAARELTALPAQAPERKALRSLLNHRDGLSVFLERRWVPMDNNAIERVIRGPVIGRSGSRIGSVSEAGAWFTAPMYCGLGSASP